MDRFLKGAAGMAQGGRVLFQLVCCAQLGGAVAAAQDPAASLGRYLRDSIRLDPAQIAEADRGHAVAKVLPGGMDRDITVFGMVAVRVSRQAYQARLGDPRAIIAARTQRFGLLGDPVTAADLQRISVDSSEYRDLRSCRANDCKFKLPASRMQAFAEQVDWGSRAAKAQVDSLVRLDVERFIADYRTMGNAAMVRYDDQRGVESSDAFTALLAQSSYLHAYAPELRDYLTDYPLHRPAGARDILYWSDDRIPRLRPIFTVNQLVIYTPPSGPPLVARKQLYADHYFEAVFELLAVLDAPPSAEGQRIYLVTVRRYRFDNLPGGVLNVRGRVREQLLQLMRSDLARERAATEGAPGGHP